MPALSGAKNTTLEMMRQRIKDYPGVGALGVLREAPVLMSTTPITEL